MENEKRKHPRVACEIDSSFWNLDRVATAAPVTTVVKDISEGGIRFRAGHFVPVHNKLLFKIQIPKQKCIEVVAQPAWIWEVQSLSRFDIGAKFLSLSEDDREIIKQFTSSLPTTR